MVGAVAAGRLARLGRRLRRQGKCDDGKCGDSEQGHEDFHLSDLLGLRLTVRERLGAQWRLGAWAVIAIEKTSSRWRSGGMRGA